MSKNPGDPRPQATSRLTGPGHRPPRLGIGCSESQWTPSMSLSALCPPRPDPPPKSSGPIRSAPLRRHPKLECTRVSFVLSGHSQWLFCLSPLSGKSHSLFSFLDPRPSWSPGPRPLHPAVHSVGLRQRVGAGPWPCWGRLEGRQAATVLFGIRWGGLAPEGSLLALGALGSCHVQSPVDRPGPDLTAAGHRGV